MIIIIKKIDTLLYKYMYDKCGYFEKSKMLYDYKENAIVLKYSYIYYSLTQYNNLYNILSTSRLIDTLNYSTPLFNYPYYFDIYFKTYFIINEYVKKNEIICIIEGSYAGLSMCNFLNFSCDIYKTADEKFRLAKYKDQLFIIKNIMRNNQNKFIDFVNKVYNQEKDLNSINKKYKIILYQNFTNYQKNIDLHTFRQTINQYEYKNCIELEKLYDILNYLELGGKLIFKYYNISTERSLKLIESIVQCFEQFTTTENRQNNNILEYIFICENYKGKKEKIKNNSQGFYDFMLETLKTNERNNKNIYLTRKGCDNILKYFPHCYDLECRYLFNRHICINLMQKLNVEDFSDKLKETAVLLLKCSKHLFDRSSDRSSDRLSDRSSDRSSDTSFDRTIELKIVDVLKNIYPRKTNIINIGGKNIYFKGLFYDISLSRAIKRYIKPLTRFNKMFDISFNCIKNISHNYMDDTYRPFEILKNMDLDFNGHTIVCDNTIKPEIKKWVEFKEYTDMQYTQHTAIILDRQENTEYLFISTGQPNLLLNIINRLAINDSLFTWFDFPIRSKIMWDIIYILYCSFESLFLYVTDYKLSIYCDHFTNPYSREILIQEMDEIMKNLSKKKQSIISDNYNIGFIENFGQAYDCYMYMYCIKFDTINYIHNLSDIHSIKK